MSKQRLVFNNIEVNKKDVYASKQAISLHLINTNNIVISYKIMTPLNIVLLFT